MIHIDFVECTYIDSSELRSEAIAAPGTNYDPNYVVVTPITYNLVGIKVGGIRKIVDNVNKTITIQLYRNSDYGFTSTDHLQIGLVWFIPSFH